MNGENIDKNLNFQLQNLQFSISGYMLLVFSNF